MQAKAGGQAAPGLCPSSTFEAESPCASVFSLQSGVL